MRTSETRHPAFLEGIKDAVAGVPRINTYPLRTNERSLWYQGYGAGKKIVEHYKIKMRIEIENYINGSINADIFK